MPCIDIKLQTVEQIFDNRDPAPFRERDLDPDLADLLLDAGEDLFGEHTYKVMFWLDKPCPAGRDRVRVSRALRVHDRADAANAAAAEAGRAGLAADRPRAGRRAARASQVVAKSVGGRSAQVCAKAS